MHYVKESVHEYGRQGQRQNGVDVYAEDGDGRKIGIQCKETKKVLDEQVVLTEATNAKGFFEQLKVFIVATTDRKDKHLQDYVMTLNSSGEFPFGLSSSSGMIFRTTLTIPQWS